MPVGVGFSILSSVLASLDVPRHVAIIMDGNNRWARERGLKGSRGHVAGVDGLRAVVEHSSESGVDVLTVFAFSSENWQRPREEVSHLMALFVEALSNEVAELHTRNIRILFIGDLSAFENKLQNMMRQSEVLTAANTGMTFVIAVNYGGQWDVTNAARIIAMRVQSGELGANQVTADEIQKHISLGAFPAPDLCIRTGGEQRISNFMLWQLAYTEFYFTDAYWPDFDREALEKAFKEYVSRQRRFGRTSEQLEAG